MKNLLYYPSFEVKTSEWLKFAILYIDKLKPIIPVSGIKDLSDKYKKVLEETDLLELYSPTGIEGELASSKAINIIEEIMEKPAVYSGIIKESDYISYWKAPSNQNFTMYGDKYTMDFEYYCIDNKFCRGVPEGIAVPRTLGLIYMSLLAHIMGDNESIPAITDYEEYHELEGIVRRPNKKLDRKINIAKGLLKLKIPKNLCEINLDQIIQFRNRSGSKECLHAFHEDLDKYFDNLEQGKAERGYLDRRDSNFKLFSDEIAKLGAGVATFSLGFSQFIKNPSDPLVGAGVISAGATLTINSIIGIRKTWQNTKTERYARKYLADLKNVVS